MSNPDKTRIKFLEKLIVEFADSHADVCSNEHRHFTAWEALIIVAKSIKESEGRTDGTRVFHI